MVGGVGGLLGVAVLVLVSLEPARNLFLHDLERHLQQKKISEPEQNIFNGDDDDDDDDGDNFNDDDDDKDVADSFPSSSRLSDSLPKVSTVAASSSTSTAAAFSSNQILVLFFFRIIWRLLPMAGRARMVEIRTTKSSNEKIWKIF